jgi:signal transduction histidine kinase
MNAPADATAAGTDPIPREDFEEFVVALTHEIRNRLNSIGLEAADLAEMAGPPADASRLQEHVQSCSGLLKKLREMLAPDGADAQRMSLPQFVQKLREERGR